MKLLFRVLKKKDIKNISAFKKIHKNIFLKDNKFYAKEKITKNIQEFSRIWKTKNAKKMREMYLTNFEIVN